MCDGKQEKKKMVFCSSDYEVMGGNWIKVLKNGVYGT